LEYERWLRHHGGLRLAASIIWENEQELRKMKVLIEGWQNVEQFRQYAQDFRAEIETVRRR
jgi:hypothetical protein